MSKQTGLLTFKGKMGTVSFFKRKGEASARVRGGGGVSKERLQKDPKFQRLRENLSEFNSLAQTVKSFRQAVSKVVNLRDGSLGNRLTKVFRVMSKRSEGIRGKRPVLISQNRALIQGLELNSQQNFISIFSASFTTAHTIERNSATLELTNVLIRDMIRIPSPAATHFKLVHLLGIVSDTLFDEVSKKYSAVSENLNGLSEVILSEYLPLASSDPLTVSLEVSLPGNPVLTDDVTVIQGVGIIFYEKIGTEYYSLAQGKAMKIVNVF